jgi:hypothetical protein
MSDSAILPSGNAASARIEEDCRAMMLILNDFVDGTSLAIVLVSPDTGSGPFHERSQQ